MDKNAFIRFLIDNNIIKFGEFKTKSGRLSPYFINTGLFDDGNKISFLSKFYAEVIKDTFGEKCNVLFGPAYKGIPLVTSTAIKLWELGLNYKFCFNRKEIKHHGEGGSLIGYQPTEKDNLIILEDVITSGISIKESLEILKKNGNPRVKAVIISVDRMEKATDSNLSASQEIKSKLGIEVLPIVTIKDILSYVLENIKDKDLLKRIEKYISKYCVSF